MCKLRIQQVRLISPFFLIILFFSNCANILPLSGGDKDISPPKIQNFQVDYKNSTLYFDFDEHIVLNNWYENFYSSPFLNVTPNLENKKLVVKIDQELNEEETYLISLSNCIKDLNEGNIASNVEFVFSNNKIKDSLLINGYLVDALLGDAVVGAWVFAYEDEQKDSILFTSKPKYISKSNDEGFFTFPNLKDRPYYLYALEGVSRTYENGEKVAFYKQSVYPNRPALVDTQVSMALFDPMYEYAEDSDTGNITLHVKKIDYLPATILIDIIFPNQVARLVEESALLFQLTNEDGFILTNWNDTIPYKIKNIPPGQYKLKCVLDLNSDKKWTTGSIAKNILPEITLIYPDNIIIRPDSDIELKWRIAQSKFLNHFKLN